MALLLSTPEQHSFQDPTLELDERRLSDWLTGLPVLNAGESLRWSVKDASEQGYRLAWEESAASLLQVGDLVCVVGDSDQERQDFQLLLVRWVCDERDKGTQLGVEKLPGVPNPVRVVIPGEGDGNPHQALFLPSSGSQGSLARLLVPSKVYEENRALLVYVGEREIAIRCGARVAQGAEFDCVEFLAGE